MRLAILGAGNSIHTQRWLKALQNDFHLALISMHRPDENVSTKIKYYQLPFQAPLGYYLNFWFLRQVLQEFQADLLHVHYASGYGTLARLSGFHPCILSVWGSDIFDFPNRSALNRSLLKANLNHADRLLATSEALALETRKYTSQQKIGITPFGIETQVFLPVKQTHSKFRIGTVKKLEHIYGIDRLLKSFALAKQKGLHNACLTIAGEGSQKLALQNLAIELGIQNDIEWLGQIQHAQVPDILNNLDVYLALSREESFGVAILEAMACEVPVIVSNAPGLREIVQHDKTGWIVENGDPDKVSELFIQLAQQKKSASIIAQQARNYVIQNYNWASSVQKMKMEYEHLFKPLDE